jgi:Tol biopolymer transport system component
MRKHHVRGVGVLRLSLVCAVLVLPAIVSPAYAQYFGRNKVEYNDFDFQILTTEHFDIYYYEREERAARIAAQLAERWYARISTVLNHRLERRQPLVIYGSQAEFAQTNVVGGLVPDSVGGVTESLRRRIVMPFAPTMAETDRVLGHELVHAFQFDIARRYGGGTAQPLWFVEGMAEYLARGSADAESELWLRDAVRTDRLPRKQGEAARKLSPYQYGHAFWSYLGNRFGDAVVEKALKPDKKNRRLQDRIHYATGVDLETLHVEWRRSVFRVYGVPRGTDRPELWSRNGMQLGPSLSPDGKRAVFFSERDRLSLDLFLVDVNGGRVIRKLATTAASARFDSLQALRSTGAWSPEGDWFAFPAVRQGHATLILVAMREGRENRELAFDELGQILTPTWSPDGKSIAFSALSGGFTDLYVFNLSTNTLRQLTDDSPADLQPSWSHDGHTIAFVSERYGSNVESLTFGRPQLAVFDLDTDTIRRVDVGDIRAQLNPQWSLADDEIYFIGDGDGVANVYRVAVATEQSTPSVERLTSVHTGVSGVTPSSPALSVAASAPVVAYTLYERGRPQLVIFDASTATARTVTMPAPGKPAKPTVEVVPSRGLVDRVRADQQTGLPDLTTLGKREYSSRMSLETIGQPYMSSGGGPFGTFVRAGGALMFGDMLGERRLGAALQIGNHLRDSAFEFRFLNQERRWNWGAIGELAPGLRRYRRFGDVEYDGQPALLKQTDYLQRMQMRMAGLVAYPFNRGLRLELTAGVRHAMYHRELRSQIASATTGKVLSTDRVTSSGGDPTTVAEVGAALVHDTTAFGLTGPLVGSRYRLEITPAVGDLSYVRVLSDYRRYMMPVKPYSLAVRVLHSARYGPDGDDTRLMSSFLGSASLVRGHRLDLRECPPDLARVCGEELLGSRLLVSNVEIRFPLWGMLSRQLEYGWLPADGFLFADGGLVWSGTQLAGAGVAAHGKGFTGISSIGGGIRLNAGGLPFEIAAIRSLDGPRPEWQTDFGFRVGF